LLEEASEDSAEVKDCVFLKKMERKLREKERNLQNLKGSRFYLS